MSLTRLRKAEGLGREGPSPRDVGEAAGDVGAGSGEAVKTP